jgi:hypothetical protein
MRKKLLLAGLAALFQHTHKPNQTKIPIADRSPDSAPTPMLNADRACESCNNALTRLKSNWK